LLKIENPFIQGKKGQAGVTNGGRKRCRPNTWTGIAGPSCSRRVSTGCRSVPDRWGGKMKRGRSTCRQ